MRDFHAPGRSTAHSTRGMAACSQPLATLAALDILRQGGNAIDAAVAAAAVLCVVEPQSTAIGGDMFALVSKGGSDQVIGINGSGRAPKKLTAQYLMDLGHNQMPSSGVHTVTVPGAIDGWARLIADHGKLSLAQVLAPAIDHAEHGYAVSPRIAWDWFRMTDKLKGDSGAASIYLPNGKSPEVGDVMRLPALAKTLKKIATEGRDGFYRGEAAANMVSYLKSRGGTHELEDFAANEPEYVTPIRTTYRGHTVCQIPPNGQGITVLLLLNILAGFDLKGMDPLGPDRMHLEAEATRLAFRMRDELVADPRQEKVPVEAILSERYAAKLRGKIDMKRAMGQRGVSDFPAHPDTVYLSVVDSERNLVSFINSTFSAFGSGLADPATGVNFQNRGWGFRLQPGHPNCVAPGKRPMHTIIPGMVLKDGRGVAAYGVMGGQFQPVGHSHVLTNIIDFGMDPQAAIDCPRGFAYNATYELERGIPEATATALAARGHEISRPEGPHGGGQMIWVDHEKGTLTGGSDPRKDGCAVGY